MEKLLLLAFFAAFTITSLEAGYCKMSRDDTLYVYPSENNCSVFIVCHHNEEYEMSCLEAPLFSDIDERLCLEKCDNKATTRRVTMNSYEYTTDYSIFPADGEPAKTVLCPSEGEVLASIPHECHEYIECQDGIGTRQRCENGMEFSPIEHKCMPEENSNCVVKKSKGTPHSKCRFQRGSSSALLLPSKKCSEFRKCSHLMAWTISCPHGTLFDVDAKICEWEENVQCEN